MGLYRLSERSKLYGSELHTYTAPKRIVTYIRKQDKSKKSLDKYEKDGLEEMQKDLLALTKNRQTQIGFWKLSLYEVLFSSTLDKYEKDGLEKMQKDLLKLTKNRQTQIGFWKLFNYCHVHVYEVNLLKQDICKQDESEKSLNEYEKDELEDMQMDLFEICNNFHEKRWAHPKL
ncbi:hypothetical protein F8M41_008014 [Gigaspora margarita]|uniref:Uncharacterized protein n=1 Tax=Gigaspora margarita TaxID=4874 RepID=A0A8H3X5Z5_GIGMA|nr:hypothetical protein F8M41_008014 [Gigaspora margarita]